MASGIGDHGSHMFLEASDVANIHRLNRRSILKEKRENALFSLFFITLDHRSFHDEFMVARGIRVLD